MSEYFADAAGLGALRWQEKQEAKRKGIIVPSLVADIRQVEAEAEAAFEAAAEEMAAEIDADAGPDDGSDASEPAVVGEGSGEADA